MRPAQTSTACAFAWFGAATAINLLMFEGWTFMIYWRYDRWPEAAHNLFMVAGLTPLVAGLLTGLTQPHPDGKAILRVQVVLLLFTLLCGLTLLPHVDVLNLAVCQLFWWLPGGSLTAVTIATLAQRLRRPRFERASAIRRPIC